MQRLFLASFAALCLATPGFGAEIACTGPFAADSSETRLIETFGAENVVTGEVDGPEGSTLLATTIFPGDSVRQMEFGWWDEAALERPAYFTLPPGDIAPGGLRVGLTIDEVEALNGGPFSLYGFWWDYGGAAGFEGGKLADAEGGCVVSVRFQPAGAYSDDLDVAAISGDSLIFSTEPLLDTVGAVVETVTIGYPDVTAIAD